MNTRIHSYRPVSLGAAFLALLALQPALADLRAPYVADANTLHLWHLDEADPGPAAPAAGVTGSFDLTPDDGKSPGSPAVLGVASFLGFGTAADTSAGQGSGMKGVAIPVEDVTGPDGAFTFEAIVNTSEYASGQQIISMEGNDNANRPFQFRFDNDSIRFINISGGGGTILTPLPTTGPHAFVPNEWFHVAVTYNGVENTADNFKVYWTRVDPVYTEANEINSANMTADLGPLAPNTTIFGVGNLYRTSGSGNTNNLEGLIDEVRISDIARAADEMLFEPAGPDLDPPLLASTDPVDDAPLGVAVSVTLTASFNEDVQAGTGNIIIRNLTDVSDTTIPVTDGTQVTVSGTTVTIDPTADLAPEKDYAVLIDAGAVEDLANNAFAGITDETTWNFSTDGTAPSLVSVSPADDAIEVLVGANLVAAFDEPIVAGTGNITIRQSSDDAVVESFDVTTSPQLSFGTSSVTIDPTADLAAGAGFYVEIDATAIEDVAENSFAGLAGPAAWNFTTAASQSTVVLFADDFSDGSLAVPVDPNDPGSSISGTLSGSFLGDPYLQLNVGGGTLGGEAGGEASWSNLNAPGTGSGVITLECDLAGNSTLAAAQQFTVQVLGLNPVDDGDGTNGNWVAINLFQPVPPTDAGNPVVTAGTTGLGVFFRDNGMASVWSAGDNPQTDTYDAAPANGSYDISIAVTNISGFGPGNSFDYEVSVGGVPLPGLSGSLTGVDTSGNFISLESRNSSSTISEVRVETIASDNDLIPPALKATSPADEAPSVLADTDLVAVFDEPIVAGTGNVEVRLSLDDSLIESFDVASSGQLTVSGGKLTIDPTGSLPDGGVYVLVDATALDDAAGNSFVGVSDKDVWNFTVDGTAPMASGMTPMADTSDSAPFADLSLSFDEDVVVGTGNITIFLASDDSVVEAIDVTSGAVTIVGGEVTINPAGDLDYNTAYYVQIDAGAFTDVAGNPIAGINDTTTWAFTTGPVPSGLIFAEDFAGDVSDLDGTIPDTRPFGETWVASTLFNQDGTTEDGPGSATLAFTPFDGFIYTLDASFSGLGLVSDPDNDWVAAGFVNGQSAASGGNDRFITGNVVGTAWMLTRGDQSLDPNVVAYLGTGQLGAGNGGLAGGSVETMLPTEPAIDLRVVLDTTGGPDMWTAAWFAKRPGDADYTEIRPAELLPVGAAISAVGVARSNAGIEGTVESFSLTGAVPAAEELVLTITENAGLLDFSWNGMAGMQYDLVSTTDPEAEPDPSLWAPYNDGVTTYQNLTGNAATGVQLVGPTRLFALIEEEIPPLFSEDFESDDGGFTVIDNGTGSVWAYGTPNSDGGAGGGSVTAGNNGSTNCWGTDITNPGTYASGTDTSLISPVIDLTGLTSATLAFAQAVDILSPDALTVNIIDDDISGGAVVLAGGGAIYTEDDSDTLSADWEEVTGIDLSAGLGQPVRLEFRFAGNGDGTYVGAYIDDVMVTGE